MGSQARCNVLGRSKRRCGRSRAATSAPASATEQSTARTWTRGAAGSCSRGGTSPPTRGRLRPWRRAASATRTAPRWCRWVQQTKHAVMKHTAYNAVRLQAAGTVAGSRQHEVGTSSVPVCPVGCNYWSWPSRTGRCGRSRRPGPVARRQTWPAARCCCRIASAVAARHATRSDWFANGRRRQGVIDKFAGK